MATALYDGISVLDNVIVTPTLDSSLDVRDRIGQTATVYQRNGDDIAIVFDGGCRLCVSRAEIARACSVSDRMMAHAR